MDKYTAVETAAAYIESKGFEFVARSSLSEARYFKRAGMADNLRVAAHPCRHGFKIAANLTIDYRGADERDEKTVSWIRSTADLYRECDDLIAEYDANATEDDDN